MPYLLAKGEDSVSPPASLPRARACGAGVDHRVQRCTADSPVAGESGTQGTTTTTGHADTSGSSGKEACPKGMY